MSNDELTFEQNLEQLESVVNDLECGKLSLDDALARYQRGVNLLRQCDDKLKQVEQKIQQLTGVDESGQPVLAPFPGANAVEPPKRGRKRSESE